MKTVVQQIIEKFEHIQKNDCKTLPEHIFFDGVLAILDSVYLDIENSRLLMLLTKDIETENRKQWFRVKMMFQNMTMQLITLLTHSKQTKKL